ncbi:hypothetical protein SAY87_006573 [Trapa incisa]|uniref:Uncharacterized protein n=1 Tax=Trapa incisa TaxID=236973 RepID=A0AAN7JYW1_9MYRT|nr:hypothetical protein SAY87_006573 [Trapa incisa]
MEPTKKTVRSNLPNLKSQHSLRGNDKLEVMKWPITFRNKCSQKKIDGIHKKTIRSNLPNLIISTSLRKYPIIGTSHEEHHMKATSHKKENTGYGSETTKR